RVWSPATNAPARAPLAGQRQEMPACDATASAPGDVDGATRSGGEARSGGADGGFGVGTVPVAGAGLRTAATSLGGVRWGACTTGGRRTGSGRAEAVTDSLRPRPSRLIFCPT